MEMNFPHHDLPRAMLKQATDFRALLAHAIARQGNSETARVMLRGDWEKSELFEDDADFLEQRIEYFATSTPFKKQRATPQGAFFLLNRSKNDVELNCKDGVYQDASVNIKPANILSELSEQQAVHAGQEN